MPELTIRSMRLIAVAVVVAGALAGGCGGERTVFDQNGKPLARVRAVAAGPIIRSLKDIDVELSGAVVDRDTKKPVNGAYVFVVYGAPSKNPNILYECWRAGQTTQSA